mmetsp:Transcript_6164/g.10292  ORF Transcript_6164/g.10292 Transcript_6164/m.10292 type:complete len:246 (-) Transcript_6164:131-868(-)
MSQPIVRRLAASPSFFLLSLLVGLLVCGLAAAESGCPDVEPEAWSPCTADQDGVSCNLGEEYGGDPFCWKDCDGEVWTHLCAGGGMPPPQDEQVAEQPAETTTEDNAVDTGTEVVEDEGQFTDIIADCQVPIGAAIGCFSTSQEPACEGFDPMSLLAGELPIPENCEEADDLVCSALVGCCDKEIADIAACAAKSNLDLDCDIDCGTGPIPTPAPDATSSGRPIKTGLHGLSWSLLLAPFIGWNI